MENAPSATNVFPIFPYLLLVEFNGGREYRLFDFSRRLEEPVYAPLGEWPVFRQAACHPEGATNKWCRFSRYMATDFLVLLARYYRQD